VTAGPGICTRATLPQTREGADKGRQQGSQLPILVIFETSLQILKVNLVTMTYTIRITSRGSFSAACSFFARQIPAYVTNRAVNRRTGHIVFNRIGDKSRYFWSFTLPS
jgi:hypothetical protein